MQIIVLENVKKNRATNITTYCSIIYMLEKKNKDANTSHAHSGCRSSAECGQDCSYNITDNL